MVKVVSSPPHQLHKSLDFPYKELRKDFRRQQPSAGTFSRVVSQSAVLGMYPSNLSFFSFFFVGVHI